MAGDFMLRSQEIIDRVGGGSLVGCVEVNQVYAHYQHENLALKHPRGGQARYLADPLMRNASDYLQEIAATVLDDGGRRSMIMAMEHLSAEVETHAPWEFKDLQHSGHPTVTDGGRLIYDRPPVQHRLTEAELEAKKDADPSGWAMIKGDHVYVGKKGPF